MKDTTARSCPCSSWQPSGIFTRSSSVSSAFSGVQWGARRSLRVPTTTGDGTSPKACMRRVEKAMAKERFSEGTDSSTARFIAAVVLKKKRPAQPKRRKNGSASWANRLAETMTTPMALSPPLSAEATRNPPNESNESNEPPPPAVDGLEAFRRRSRHQSMSSPPSGVPSKPAAAMVPPNTIDAWYSLSTYPSPMTNCGPKVEKPTMPPE
mmetsp:Transcript_23973/g.54103  ORF Transcript_23973/g.54103 Transcript_23973/m.54103 type:complete len:210 (-) Transcript_23973:212-841(-)